MDEEEQPEFWDIYHISGGGRNETIE